VLGTLYFHGRYFTSRYFGVRDLLMATISTALRNRLTNYAGFSTIAQARMYPAPIPQKATYPLVTYQKISGLRSYAMGAQIDMVRSRFQIDIWATDYDACEALADQVRLALSNYRGTSDTIVIDLIRLEDEQGPMLDEGSELQRVIQDYILDFRETTP
jgi:hypothetical protein